MRRLRKIGQQGHIVSFDTARKVGGQDLPHPLFPRQGRSVFRIGLHPDAVLHQQRGLLRKCASLKNLPRMRLALLDVGLIERIHPQDASGHGRRHLPAEKFLSDIDPVRQVNANDGMSGLLERRDLLVCLVHFACGFARIGGVAEIDKKTIPSIHRRRAHRLVMNGDDARIVLSEAFGDQLFQPETEGARGGGGDPGELVLPAPRHLPQEDPQNGPRVLIQRDLGIAFVTHHSGPFQQTRGGKTHEGRRRHAEPGKGGVSPADVGHPGQDVPEAIFPRQTRKGRSGVANGDKALACPVSHLPAHAVEKIAIQGHDLQRGAGLAGQQVECPIGVYRRLGPPHLRRKRTVQHVQHRFSGDGAEDLSKDLGAEAAPPHPHQQEMGESVFSDGIGKRRHPRERFCRPIGRMQPAQALPDRLRRFMGP